MPLDPCFVMYGQSGPSLLIESTYSMIHDTNVREIYLEHRGPEVGNDF